MILALLQVKAYTHAGNQEITMNQLSQPAFVLVRPQMGENIGSAARAMWNFGLDRMRIVDPRYGWPNQKAVALASGAGRLLDEAGLYESTPDALADRTFTFATTARSRDLTKPVFSPEGAMKKAAEIIASGGKVAVLFGPERSGLENDDIARANAIVSVPVNPEFASLNLAQCVLLMGYEWRRTTHEIIHETLEFAGTEPATGIAPLLPLQLTFHRDHSARPLLKARNSTGCG